MPTALEILGAPITLPCGLVLPNRYVSFKPQAGVQAAGAVN